jgi:8-oxo-dGTP diphosphatase
VERQRVSEPVPIFGEKFPGRRYVERRAAYAVIWNDDGRVATVRTYRGHFLPGGGIEDGESDEVGLIREVREECARALAIDARIGEAIQYFGASRGYFEGQHVFFAGRFASEASGPAEHELIWLDAANARAQLFHASHVWAIDVGRPETP